MKITKPRNETSNTNTANAQIITLYYLGIIHLKCNKKYNFTITNQSAYKSSHSTETALLKIQNNIALSVDSGKAVALTLLDLSAAFDTVYHSLLYDCLHDWFGLDGTVLL